MAEKRGQFIFIASVTVGCLAMGVIASTLPEKVPPLVVAVLLACGVASLLYGVIEGVSEAGFNLGPLKFGGSAAVLLGGTWLFNFFLQQQVADQHLQDYRFKLNQHVTPSDNWFAIDENTAIPIPIVVTDPVDKSKKTTLRPPNSGDNTAGLALRLEAGANSDRYLVLGATANIDQALGHVSLSELIRKVGGDKILASGESYGPKRLFLPLRGGRLTPDKSNRWGNRRNCLGRKIPMQLEVARFDEGSADYKIIVCGSNEDARPNHESSLARGDVELVSLEIEGRLRTFAVTVVGANHRKNPAWSAFLVIEMESRR